jgi:hypothetical protein
MDVAKTIHLSPSQLMSAIILLVHNFSMNTLGTIMMWLNTIKLEVVDVSVSKHTVHVRFTVVFSLQFCCNY